MSFAGAKQTPASKKTSSAVVLILFIGEFASKFIGIALITNLSQSAQKNFRQVYRKNFFIFIGSFIEF